MSDSDSRYPFRDLSNRALSLARQVEDTLETLSTTLRDIDAAERNEAWKSAQTAGLEIHKAAVGVVSRAEYLVNVIEAQHIGNTSEAWRTGVVRLVAALDEYKRLWTSEGTPAAETET